MKRNIVYSDMLERYINLDYLTTIFVEGYGGDNGKMKCYRVRVQMSDGVSYTYGKYRSEFNSYGKDLGHEKAEECMHDLARDLGVEAHAARD